MFKAYLKIAVRQLLKNKTFSFINIIGLSIGMAAVILLLLWVRSELTYDNFHTKRDRIYSLWNRSFWGTELTCWDVTPTVAAPTLRQYFPEVEKVTRVGWLQTKWVKVNNQSHLINGTPVDPEFLSMFDFPLIKGDPRTVFKDPHSIVITPEASMRLFGTENSVGKVIELENKVVLTVTGIISTPPDNSTFKFESLTPWKLSEGETPENNWGDNSTRTYLLLKPNTNVEALQAKIKKMRYDYAKDNDPYDMFIYPMTRWRLHSNFESGIESGGRIEAVTMFSIISGIILLIACINFMNLSTARSEKRAKEVGIRKTVGAEKISLVKQFLGETILLAFVSFLIALAIVYASLPAYNKLIVKHLELNFFEPLMWLYAIAFVIIAGILAGLYPAFYISAFNPIKVLKGTFKAVKSSIAPRRILVVTQFVIAIVLIIATIIIKQQINHVNDRDVGYNQDKLVYHFLNENLEKNYNIIKQQLLAQHLVESVTKSSSPITQGWSDSWGFEWEGKDPKDKTDFDRYFVDEEFIRTSGAKLAMGRDFDLKQYATDSTAAIINESSLKIMRFKDPIGQTIKDGDTKFHVIGVVKDFVLNSPFQPTKPMIIMGAKGWFNVINMRLTGNKQNLAKIENIFKKYNPDFPFDLKYVDIDHQSKLEDINRTSTLATLFTVLTIVISCLGLFGLASFMAENKIKEIGIRKVLGASVSNIVFMLSSNFLLLVAVALFIATPLAWWLMSKWVQNYPYHVDIKWWVFALAGSLALLISLVTVSYQSLRAAISNPVKSLRTE